jgi:hypothetical protein
VATLVLPKRFRDLPELFKARRGNVLVSTKDVLGVLWRYPQSILGLFSECTGAVLGVVQRGFYFWPDLGLADCPRGGVPAPKVRVNHALLGGVCRPASKGQLR